MVERAVSNGSSNIDVHSSQSLLWIWFWLFRQEYLDYFVICDDNLIKNVLSGPGYDFISVMVESAAKLSRPGL